VQGSDFQVAEDDADPLAHFIFRNSDGLSELQTYADELTGAPATAFARAQGTQVAAIIRADDSRQVRLGAQSSFRPADLKKSACRLFVTEQPGVCVTIH
jgi:hypothetical protein